MSSAAPFCLQCGEPTRNPKYCSNTCQRLFQRQLMVDAWLEGEISGLDTLGLLRKPLRAWVIEQRGECCEVCGWSERNQSTGRVPLVADHIDGDHLNNRPENIRLLCPNCDSLQPTYKSLNRGRGRSWRRIGNGS